VFYCFSEAARKFEIDALQEVRSEAGTIAKTEIILLTRRVPTFYEPDRFLNEEFIKPKCYLLTVSINYICMD